MNDFIAGQYMNQGYYKSFQPNFINKEWVIDDMEVFKLLSTADRQLGRLDMYSEHVNIELFISMHIAKEATQSSKIEGTQTNIEEAFLDKDEISIEKRNDWEEVQNYIEAMNNAVELLGKLPFSSRLIKMTHKILLQGVRGENRMPGEFRKSQNWIGGASINDAVFIPPVHTSVPELISDLENFANDLSNPLPDLLKIALIHYHFETIHPFLDGNGRIGRLLITIYLVSKGILKKPILYLSDFFERNRTLYYDNLMRVRTHNDLNQWFKFFLVGIIETCKNGVNTFENILQLQKDIENKIQLLKGRAIDGQKIVDYLYKNPVIRVSKVEQIIQKSNVSAYSLIASLEKLEILKEITGAQRGKLYVFENYLNIFNENDII
ncbi:Fic family protein [Apibacter mensalis]|uniref:Fic family protein n=1 Tax=Apibacter mensalis TaxID=1586267 RepID=UPI0026F00E66|nr:Fic family protein [Apibacter mensalis]